MALPTPSANDGPRFHTNVPVSELIESDTRAVEASVVYSAPLIAKIEDGVTRKLRPTPIRPKGLRGSSRSIRDRETEVRRLAREGSEAASCQTRARGENADAPQRPLPNPH